MKLLFLLYSPTEVCSYYRAGGVIRDLKSKIPNLVVDVREYRKILIHWQNLLDYDIVMMQRPFEAQAVSLCSYIKNLNIPLWIDWDDNLWEVPTENEFYLDYFRSKNNLAKIAQYADVISVSTLVLHKEVSAYSDNVVLVPNAFNDSIFDVLKRELPKRENLVIWRGTAPHIRNVLSFSFFLQKIMDENPSWKFLYQGLYPWYLFNNKLNLQHVPFCDVMLYFNSTFQIAPKVLHVLLTDTIFNRCRSNTSYIDASYFGAVCVCPKFEEWLVPGAINYEDVQGYFEAMKAIINGDVDIEKLSNISWENVCDTLLLSKVNSFRVNIINSLLQ